MLSDDLDAEPADASVADAVADVPDVADADAADIVGVADEDVSMPLI